MMTEHITSRHNPAVIEAVKLLSDTKYRKAAGLIAAEGTKLLSDAIDSGADIKLVMASEGLEPNLPEVVNARVIFIPEKLFGAISTQKTPQGAIFFCTRPKIGSELRKGNYVVLDGLQDPGNIGTVIRTSAALGIDGVVICGASADPFGPKAVRASMGAVFRIPVHIMNPDELRRECERSGIRLLAAMPAGEAVDIREIGRDPAAIAIGSEGSGVSDVLKSVCNGMVTIPMANGTESLNAAAAAAVVLWELARANL